MKTASTAVNLNVRVST